MSERDLSDIITQALEIYFDAEINEHVQINTFTSKGILSNNTGLVIQTSDGSEFQLTIVKSR